MPSNVATLLTLVFVLVALAWEARRCREISAAVWIPVAWLMLTGSRFISQWLMLGNPAANRNVSDGSPLDAAVFLVLMVLGVMVLARRKVQLSEVLRQNAAIAMFVIFCFLSVLWSDEIFISFKRFVKTLGHPIMALVILTDPRPVDAFRALLRRCALALLPVSILFIKYLPEYGRYFDTWSGVATNRGAMITKNDLGYMSMIFATFAIWTFLSRKLIEDARVRRQELGIAALILCMSLWLLWMSDSATSRFCLMLTTSCMLFLALPIVNRKRVGTYFFVLIGAALLAEWVFDVYSTVIELLGRNANLTDRKDVWKDAIALQSHPIVGAGFETFWLGQRLRIMWEKWWWHPIQAHNGYLEIYLNLGLIGLSLLVVMLFASFTRITRSLVADFEFGRLRLAFLLAIIAFNYTEAAFKALHPMWTLFCLISMQYAWKGAVHASKAVRKNTEPAPRYGQGGRGARPLPSRRAHGG